MSAGHSSPGIIYKSFKWIKKKLDNYGLTDIFMILTLVWFVYSGFNDGETFGRTFAFLFALLPLVMPFFLWSLLNYSWMTYIREQNHWGKREFCLLEIKLPEEITQSPYAMELVLKSMYDVGGIDTPIDEYWHGKTPPWYSLEIVSTDGVVKFHIWMFRQFKNFIESQLYAHYPGIQIFEVPDYTLKVPFDPSGGDWDFWGIEQALQKPDPYPIVTYIAHGLDKKDLKEEYKHDPLIGILEFFGSLGPGENAWMQMIIRAHTVCPYSKDPLHHIGDIEEWVEAEKEAILSKTVVDEKDKPNFSRLSEADKDAVNAIERKIHKQVFDVGMRMLYVYRKDSRKGRNNGFPTIMRAFEHGSEGRGLNGFKPVFTIGPFDYPWQDYFGYRKKKKKKSMFEGYVKRQYFYPPYAKKWIALNVEELATVYHFPGSVAHTPSLSRMASKRGEAPSNLPT